MKIVNKIAVRSNDVETIARSNNPRKEVEKINAERKGFSVLNYEDCLKFGRVDVDREVNECHKNKIKKEIVSSLPLIPPITVNLRTNHIIDGKHRYEAYKECIEEGLIDANSTIEVKYVYIPDDDVERVAIVNANTHSKSWGIDDYLNSYTKGGNPYYIKLAAWCKEHTYTIDKHGKPNLRYAAAMIKGKGCCTELKMGTFKFTDDELLMADSVHAELLEIFGLFPHLKSAGWVEGAIIAWCKVRELHTFKEWLKEFKLKKNVISRMPTQSQKDWNAIFSVVSTAIITKAA